MPNDKTPTPAAQKTTAQAAAAAKKPERLNVLKFNLAGYIAVNSKDVKTIVRASELFAKIVEDLKAGGAVITRDEEPQFTTVASDTGEE